MNINPFQKLILGSASPRRKALLEAMGIVVDIQPADVEETYPDTFKGHQITDYLAQKKADSLKGGLHYRWLLLTADTIVWHENTVLEKPVNTREARDTLRRLSGGWHEVITSVCFTTISNQQTLHSKTAVKFVELTEEMIDTYLRVGHPLDKAGAYGIQEWIGLVGIEGIKGSYTNVVGLPTELVYRVLAGMAG